MRTSEVEDIRSKQTRGFRVDPKGANQLLSLRGTDRLQRDKVSRPVCVRLSTLPYLKLHAGYIKGKGYLVYCQNLHKFTI